MSSIRRWFECATTWSLYGAIVSAIMLNIVLAFSDIDWAIAIVAFSFIMQPVAAGALTIVIGGVGAAALKLKAGPWIFSASILAAVTLSILIAVGFSFSSWDEGIWLAVPLAIASGAIWRFLRTTKIGQ